MTIETKTFSGEVTPKAEGRFTARVSTFNERDAYGDVVRPGAFRATLERWRALNDPIPVYVSHQTLDPLMQVGECNPHNCQETDKGLVVSGQLYLNEERGQKVFQQLLRRTLKEWSYSFKAKDPRRLPGGGRELTEIELIEVGPCLKGAGLTETLEVRAQAVHAAAVPQGSLLTVEQRVASYRAQLRVAQLRAARWRDVRA